MVPNRATHSAIPRPDVAGSSAITPRQHTPTSRGNKLQSQAPDRRYQSSNGLGGHRDASAQRMAGAAHGAGSALNGQHDDNDSVIALSDSGKGSKNIQNDDDEDDSVCALCLSGDDSHDNEIVVCEGTCGLSFHQWCYGVDTVPPGDEPWYCDMCLSGKKIDFRKKLYCCHYKSDMAARLLLVDEQKSGKARSKLREQDRYIHIQCAAWNPYVDTSHLPFSTTLPKIKSDWAICHFCNARYGFQIHCAHIENGEPCNISFHPMCALRHGFLDPPPVYNAKFTTCYCPKHVGDESTFTPTDSRLRTATSHDEELAIQLTRRRTLPNYTSGSRRSTQPKANISVDSPHSQMKSVRSKNISGSVNRDSHKLQLSAEPSPNARQIGDSSKSLDNERDMSRSIITPTVSDPEQNFALSVPRDSLSSRDQPNANQGAPSSSVGLVSNHLLDRGAGTAVLPTNLPESATMPVSSGAQPSLANPAANTSSLRPSNTGDQTTPLFTLGKRPNIRIRPFSQDSIMLSGSNLAPGNHPLSTGSRAYTSLASSADLRARLPLAPGLYEDQAIMLKESHSMLQKQKDTLETICGMLKDISLSSAQGPQTTASANVISTEQVYSGAMPVFAFSGGQQVPSATKAVLQPQMQEQPLLPPAAQAQAQPHLPTSQMCAHMQPPASSQTLAQPPMPCYCHFHPQPHPQLPGPDQPLRQPPQHPGSYPHAQARTQVQTYMQHQLQMQYQQHALSLQAPPPTLAQPLPRPPASLPLPQQVKQPLLASNESPTKRSADQLVSRNDTSSLEDSNGTQTLLAIQPGNAKRQRVEQPDVQQDDHDDLDARRSVNFEERSPSPPISPTKSASPNGSRRMSDSVPREVVNKGTSPFGPEVAGPSKLPATRSLGVQVGETLLYHAGTLVDTHSRMEELKRDIVYLALGTNLHQVVYDMMLSFANSSVPNDGDGVDDGNDDDGDNDSTAGYNKYARAQVGHSANAMALGLTEMGSLTKHNVLDFVNGLITGLQDLKRYRGHH